jgi:hypothetical protein
MSKKVLFRLKIALGALILIFVATNLWLYKVSLTKAPAMQNLPDAYISVYAPILNRAPINERQIDDKAPNKIKRSVSYYAKYKDMNYSVRFTEFENLSVLQSGLEAIKNHFTAENFEYEIQNDFVGGLEGLLINGSFDRQGKQYGIKAQLVADASYLWQAIVIFAQNEKNNNTAEEFIKSIVVTHPKNAV